MFAKRILPYIAKQKQNMPLSWINFFGKSFVDHNHILWNFPDQVIFCCGENPQSRPFFNILQTPHFILYKVISFWSWQYYEVGTNPRDPEIKTLKSLWHLFLLKVDIIYQIIFIATPFSSSRGVWAQEKSSLIGLSCKRATVDPHPEITMSWRNFRPCKTALHPGAPSWQPTCSCSEARMFTPGAEFGLKYRSYQPLTVSINHWQYLSTVDNIYQTLTVSINHWQYLSTVYHFSCSSPLY